MTANPLSDTSEFSLPDVVPEAARQPPPPARVEVDVDALSHQGNVRKNNEDVYFVGRAERALQTLCSNLPAGLVPERYEDAAYGLAIADGMGGVAGGEVASRLAVATLLNLILNTADWIMRAGKRESERLLQRIARRYRQVDAVLRAEALADPKLAGMGTTMTLAYSLGRDLFVGHVGDSRVYFAHDDQVHQLTRDHTCAQSLADQGVIRPEEVATHRLRHVLTRALGGSMGELQVDVERVSLSDGDQVLLCTDGLTDMVDDDAIAGVLRGAATARAACHALVDLALQNGGKDNVTVVVARYRFA